MEDKRYFLKLSYKGTNYCGWQIQPKDKTVQGEINTTLKKLNSNVAVHSMGCGRTDTGVHATQFYAHFDFKVIPDLEHFKFKMNNMLSHDIVIHDVFEVGNEAHARYDAISRTYQYFISTRKNAFNNDVVLYNSQELDLLKMNLACSILLEYDDFECFSKVKTEVNNFKCSISEANWELKGDILIFTISANRFLRNMVRSIVGTMIEIGEGKIKVDDLHKIIKSKKRASAGKSVSANGLFLTNIKYPMTKNNSINNFTHNK